MRNKSAKKQEVRAAVVCDICGRRGPSVSANEHAATKAIIMGWVQYSDMLVCPSCDYNLRLKRHDARRLLEANPTARDAYRHSQDPRYAPELPDYGKYYLRLAELGEGDHRGKWGIAFRVTEEERGLFRQLQRPGTKYVLLYKEGERWACKTGESLQQLIYGLRY